VTLVTRTVLFPSYEWLPIFPLNHTRAFAHLPRHDPCIESQLLLQDMLLYDLHCVVLFLIFTLVLPLYPALDVAVTATLAQQRLGPCAATGLNFT
jgi:hypothetical protein